jgi:hypothetical protein
MTDEIKPRYNKDGEPVCRGYNCPQWKVETLDSGDEHMGLCKIGDMILCVGGRCTPAICQQRDDAIERCLDKEKELEKVRADRDDWRLAYQGAEEEADVAEALHDRVARLETKLAEERRRADMGWAQLDDANEMVNRLFEERDEARREVCELCGHYVTGNGVADCANIAIERGWDCFDEE